MQWKKEVSNEFVHRSSLSFPDGELVYIYMKILENGKSGSASVNSLLLSLNNVLSNEYRFVVTLDCTHYQNPLLVLGSSLHRFREFSKKKKKKLGALFPTPPTRFGKIEKSRASRT